MKVKGISERSKGNILQDLRPSLSYYLSSRSLFTVVFIGYKLDILIDAYLTKYAYLVVSHIRDRNCRVGD